MSDIETRARRVISDHLCVEPEKITTDAKFLDDLGADSLDEVELVMALEEEFGVEIPDDAAQFVTFGDAVSFLADAMN